MTLTTKIRKKTSRNIRVKKTPYEIEKRAHEINMRDRNYRVHNALMKAADSIGLNQYEVQRREHIKRGRSPKTFRYTPTTAHRRVIEASRLFASGKLTKDDAMAVLHEYEVMHERLPSAPLKKEPGGTKMKKLRRGLR